MQFNRKQQQKSEHGQVLQENWIYGLIIVKDMKQRLPLSYLYHVIFVPRRLFFVLAALYLFDQAWLQAVIYLESSMIALGLLLAV